MRGANDAGGARERSRRAVKRKEGPIARVIQAHCAGRHERGQGVKVESISSDRHLQLGCVFNSRF